MLKRYIVSVYLILLFSPFTGALAVDPCPGADCGPFNVGGSSGADYIVEDLVTISDSETQVVTMYISPGTVFTQTGAHFAIGVRGNNDPPTYIPPGASTPLIANYGRGVAIGSTRGCDGGIVVEDHSVNTRYGSHGENWDYNLDDYECPDPDDEDETIPCGSEEGVIVGTCQYVNWQPNRLYHLELHVSKLNVYFKLQRKVGPYAWITEAERSCSAGDLLNGNPPGWTPDYCPHNSDDLAGNGPDDKADLVVGSTIIPDYHPWTITNIRVVRF